ncbi:MAG: phosphoenolpyruvate carboxykinase [Planctomycetes bacterium]|nr:phosphoenolpyruvate carboxykinase [Planctomycetota bacterium]
MAVIFHPSPEDLFTLTGEMPSARKTRYGTWNVQTKVLARSKGSTRVVSDRPQEHSDSTIPVAEFERIARLQDDYIRSREMIVVDGTIGNDPAFATRARLVVERGWANIAAMQQILYFGSQEAGPDWDPELTVIDTPGLPAPGYPNDRLIAVDLRSGVTRVLHSDYFGESKKGGLRMWNRLVYDQGGLAMHAGLKSVPVGNRRRTVLIVGLSGTGKTTTTFTRQNGSSPLQDDFIGLMPGGRVYATENGCFAKTYGLSAENEPAIHKAVTSRHAYLENVSQNDKGELDFLDESYTQNGRSVIRMADIDGAGDMASIGKPEILLILNRNETIIPGVARLSLPQAAAYFMLGETKGTAAGGAEEAGKFLRVPGTNPFFPLLHAQQGNRFLDLLKTCPMEVYLMNTGRVGGSDTEKRSRKVKIHHSSAIVKGIAEGTIRWTRDPDFGYEVASSVPGIDDADGGILRPKELYASQGRAGEYASAIRTVVRERIEYLRKWPLLRPEILAAVS